MRRDRLWMWAQPLVAALALTGFAAALLFQAADRNDLIPSVQALITATFVYPGLAVSMLVNHAIVLARRPRRLTTIEKLLVLAQFGVAGLLALTSLETGALLFGFLLWPLLIIAAVSACFTMAGTTIRSRRALRHPLSAEDLVVVEPAEGRSIGGVGDRPGEASRPSPVG